PQVLVNNRNRILQNLPGAVSIFPKLCLVIAELVKQAFTEVTASYARRIELPDDFDRLVKLTAVEADLKGWPGSIYGKRRGLKRRWRGTYGGSIRILNFRLRFQIIPLLWCFSSLVNTFSVLRRSRGRGIKPQSRCLFDHAFRFRRIGFWRRGWGHTKQLF